MCTRTPTQEQKQFLDLNIYIYIYIYRELIRESALLASLNNNLLLNVLTEKKLNIIHFHVTHLDNILDDERVEALPPSSPHLCYTYLESDHTQLNLI